MLDNIITVVLDETGDLRNSLEMLPITSVIYFETISLLPNLSTSVPLRDPGYGVMVAWTRALWCPGP